MKRISLLLFLIGAFLLPVQYLSAQIFEPVHWSISENKTTIKHFRLQPLPQSMRDGISTTKIFQRMAQYQPK